MPSPFPGMDPYLEGHLWLPIHHELSSRIAWLLSPKLLPKYVALPQERLVYEESDSVSVTAGDIYPDVSVRQQAGVARGTAETAVLEAPVRLTTLIAGGVPHVSVEIRDVQNRRLVTSIEVLSPTNKGSRYDEYLAKRQRVLLSDAHLIEVDLLRAGRRPPMKETLPRAHYFVFLSRAEERPVTEVWPISLKEKLPTVPVPLLPEDDDVSLDLQQAFSEVYDALGFRYIADYAGSPPGPLSPSDSEWALERLAEAGVNSDATISARPSR